MGKSSLIIFRHAHRDTSKGKELDNGLTEKGKEQAKIACLELTVMLRDRHPALISSPARRCLETLAPLEAALDRPVRQSVLLEEQHAEESDADFKVRIETFLEREVLDGQLVVACTHGDWIEQLGQTIEGKKLDLSKGTFVRFEREGGRWQKPGND